jgi:hypothetical protein
VCVVISTVVINILAFFELEERKDILDVYLLYVYKVKRRVRTNYFISHVSYVFYILRDIWTTEAFPFLDKIYVQCDMFGKFP